MIFGAILRFLQGEDSICCPAGEGAEVLHAELVQAMADAEITPYFLRHTATGDLEFSVPHKQTEILRKLPMANRLLFCAGYGLPALVFRYRHRIGIPIGALLFCLLLFLGSSVIWRVDVQGVETVSSDSIIAQMEEMGCHVGTSVFGLDLYAVSNRLLAAEPTLAYASVVRNGTVLVVQVRESFTAPPQTEDTPANLVATKDGTIVSYAVDTGQIMVHAGQAVRAGDLLVSGVVLHRDGSLSVVRATGRVYAKTTCTAGVEVPLTTEKNEVAGRVICDSGMKFFGWEINFFKSTGNIDIECDTITEWKQWTLFGRILLPIWQQKTYLPVTKQTVQTYTPAEAVRQATARAMEQVRAQLGQAEVLSATTAVTQTETGYRVEYTVECIMDITAPRQLVTGP